MAYAIVTADTSLHAITGVPVGQFTNKAERALGQLRADLCYADIDRIIDDGLHEYLDTQQQTINHIDGLLFNNFLLLHQTDSFSSPFFCLLFITRGFYGHSCCT